MTDLGTGDGSGVEEVVLLDDAGTPVGTADKALVHTTDTPLHLAFSCHLFDDAGLVLVTRRALSKRTWPGVWTNAFCGHPAPGEPMTDAIRRRGGFELGVEIDDPVLVLPDFRYRAVDASGVVENEICPVHTARAVGTLRPEPSEVAEHRWVPPEDLTAAVAAAPWAFSPWLVDQLADARLAALLS
ncbi:isopentenyl-diphosphate Delta-isomerase [Georgenia subflava]|uniref:Isopentenyl-diphosphate Delta-isomerase n=1 Tax=Georgenia subflava TaxID=1622177 RepID=A0A6N7ERN9_9MICO|nr:isopentenyl-diphosphate Delta-isomerase [Georgenia subflava]MPV38786.1 isopentenyl-diphosphate Delta-isomerase [Georgenia subflava]